MPRRGPLRSSKGRHRPYIAALGNSRRRSAGLARLRRLGRSRLKCMATSTSVPVEEYLRTTYHPDMEYVDGELVERHVGEHTHSRLQTLTVGLLFPLERSRRFRSEFADDLPSGYGVRGWGTRGATRGRTYPQPFANTNRWSALPVGALAQVPCINRTAVAGAGNKTPVPYPGCLRDGAALPLGARADHPTPLDYRDPVSGG